MPDPWDVWHEKRTHEMRRHEHECRRLFRLYYVQWGDDSTLTHRAKAFQAVRELEDIRHKLRVQRIDRYAGYFPLG